jgi:methylglutaconyl-CoA hydratase
MNYQYIIAEMQGPLALLRLNRPASRNAIHGDMITEIISFLQQVKEDPSVRILVLDGAGDVFCAGADLKWMQKAGAMDDDANRKDARDLAQCLHLLYTIPKITVARVQGAAYGGAIGLMAACDLVVIANNCSLAFTEVRLGLIPATIAPYILQKAHTGIAEYLLTGSRFDGKTAVSLHLAAIAVEEAELDNRLNTLVTELLHAAPEAQLKIRGLIPTLGKQDPDDRVVSFTASLLADIRGSAEAREGIEAFLEKRQPNFVMNHNMISHAR